MDNQLIRLELSTEEINLIFQALGNRPFNEVFELIGKINDQAAQQMKTEADNAPDTSKIREVKDDE